MPRFHLNDIMFTSWDSPGALARWAGDTVPASELHIRELRDISTALRVLTRHAVVFGARGQRGVALIMACLLGQVGQCLPHDHTRPSGELRFHTDLKCTRRRNNIPVIWHPNQTGHQTCSLNAARSLVLFLQCGTGNLNLAHD